MKRNENQFKASVKVIAASDVDNSSVGCNEPFLREIARKWDRDRVRVSGTVVREKDMW